MSSIARNGFQTFIPKKTARLEMDVRARMVPFDDTPLENSRIEDSPLFPQNNNRRAINVTGNIGAAGGRAKRVNNVKISGSPVKTGKSMTRANKVTTPTVSLNDEVCHACGESGKLICCDNCPKSYHFNCVDPPIESAEDQPGDWFCNSCQVQKEGYKVPQHGGQYFKSLLQDLAGQNPTVFKLPQSIINSFQDIQASASGSYLDKRTIRPAKLNRGWTETTREGYNIKDKHGRPAFCYHCRLPGDITTRKQVVQCDFCDQVFHLDCLSTPMVEIPSVKKKWMCPLHVERDQPRDRWAKQPTEIQTITEPGQLNNGRVEVLLTPRSSHSVDPMRRIKYQIPEETVIIDFLTKTIPLRRRKSDIEREVSPEAEQHHSQLVEQSDLHNSEDNVMEDQFQDISLPTIDTSKLEILATAADCYRFRDLPSPDPDLTVLEAESMEVDPPDSSPESPNPALSNHEDVAFHVECRSKEEMLALLTVRSMLRESKSRVQPIMRFLLDEIPAVPRVSRQ